MILSLYCITVCFVSGVGVLCEVVQMTFGLHMFKFGKCLFYCFKHGK